MAIDGIDSKLFRTQHYDRLKELSQAVRYQGDTIVTGHCAVGGFTNG